MSAIVALLAILWAAAVALLIARAIVQYRVFEQVEPLDNSETLTLPPVSIIVPARNEAANIERCVECLLRQHPRQSPSVRIFVIDDGSTDQTPALVRNLAAGDSRLTLLQAPPLPPDWKGKPHACWEGVRHALHPDASPANAPQSSPQWLCFIDADTFAEPSAISAAIAAADRRSLDMLSLEPFQELKTFPERLIIPCGLFLMAFSHDLRIVNDPRQPEATANGQFILVRASVYQEVGGHASVRDEVCEDSALARRIKSSNHRIALLGGEHLLRTRMYRDLRSLWDGLTKNVVEMAGGPGATLLYAAVAILISVASIALPLWTVLAVARHRQSVLLWIAMALSCSASAAMLATHIGEANYLRVPKIYGLIFPLAYILAAALALHAVFRKTWGRVHWKGRQY